MSNFVNTCTTRSFVRRIEESSRYQTIKIISGIATIVLVGRQREFSKIFLTKPDAIRVSTQSRIDQNQ